MIFERTKAGLNGYIPVLVNPDIIFIGTKACCQAGQNMPQKLRLDSKVIPKLLAIKLLRLFV